jgi:hypothetical protein
VPLASSVLLRNPNMESGPCAFTNPFNQEHRV